MVDTMEHISLGLKCKWIPNELLITECIGDRLWSDQVELFPKPKLRGNRQAPLLFQYTKSNVHRLSVILF